MQPAEMKKELALQRPGSDRHSKRISIRVRKPSEPMVYETLRTLDDLFCRDLMQPDGLVDTIEHWFATCLPGEWIRPSFPHQCQRQSSRWLASSISHFRWVKPS